MTSSAASQRQPIPRRCLWQDEFGHWQPISSDQIYQRVRALGKAFLEWGAQKGDRIALIGENRWEWAVTDFATLAIGAANVPIYPTLTGEQIAVLLQDAGCRIAIVSTRQQFDKLNAVRARTQLERIVIMDSIAPPEGAIAFSELMAGADERGSERDPVFDALARSVEPKDLATLIYTSGTTGEPKGVMLTHGNIAANQNYAGYEFTFDSSDVCISFLPLSHITARALDYVMYSQRRAGRLLLAVRQAAPGHARNQADGVRRRAARLRKDSPGSGAARRANRRSRNACSHWPFGMGAKHRDVVYGGGQPIVPPVEAGQQAGLFQGPRGLRRPGPGVCLRRRSAGHRHGADGSPPSASPSGKATASPKPRRSSPSIRCPTIAWARWASRCPTSN